MILQVKHIVGSIVAACAMAVAVPVSAQIEPSAPTGTRLKQKAEPMGTRDARQIQREFAGCVYRRRSKEAERLLRHSDFLNIDMEALNTSAATFENTLRMKDCLGRAAPGRLRGIGMTYTLSSLRAMLTEAAYLENRDEPFTITEADEVFLTDRPFVEAEDMDSAKILAGFADCVVHSAPVETDALVRTEPDTTEETNAIQALVPFLGPCLPAGNEIALTVASIRSIIADGLWARHAYAGTND